MSTEGNSREIHDARWIACWSAVVVVLAAWTAVVPLGGMPHVSDEVVYTLQSRLFAAGLRVGPAADNASMWAYPFWVVTDSSYGAFPPGWPALLAVGEWLGAAIWVNPLLVGALPLLVYRLGRIHVDRATARMSAMVVALSPGVWLLAATRMAHTSVLVCLAVVAVVALERTSARRWWWLGGLAAAYVTLARPFDAALIAGPLLVLGLRRAPDWGARIGWLLPPVVGGMLLLADHQRLTGDFLHFPMNAWYDTWMADVGRTGCNRLGFGEAVGCAPTLGSYGHDPTKAIRLAWETLLRFDALFLGIHGGVLIAVAGAVLCRARRGWLLVVLIVGGYALYWSPGRAYGARFWHPLYLVAPIAVGAAMARFRMRWAVIAAVSAAVVGGSRTVADIADRYWCVDGSLASELRQAGIEEGVVFLQGDGHRNMAWPAVGVEALRCDPMLESGDGFSLVDPTRQTGGLQIRHGLSTRAEIEAYMLTFHPGIPAWQVNHDVSQDTRSVEALGIVAPR